LDGTREEIWCFDHGLMDWCQRKKHVFMSFLPSNIWNLSINIYKHWNYITLSINIYKHGIIIYKIYVLYYSRILGTKMAILRNIPGKVKNPRWKLLEKWCFHHWKKEKRGR
jgi:hypothetical protein